MKLIFFKCPIAQEHIISAVEIEAMTLPMKELYDKKSKGWGVGVKGGRWVLLPTSQTVESVVEGASWRCPSS